MIGAGLTIEGKIIGSGHVRIAGRFHGDVQVQGDVTIERGAKLIGGIRAGTVTNGGELEGNIEAATRVDLLSTGIMNGNLVAGSLTVAAGSRMHGQMTFVLRGDGDVPAARQVAARVSAAIAREPVRAATLLSLPGREALLRSVAGLAVAAGVAFGAVMLVPQVAGPGSPDTAGAVVAQAAEPAVVPVADVSGPGDEPAGTYVTPPATGAPGGLPQAELANYLVAHYGYASPLVRRSVGAGLISAPAGSASAEENRRRDADRPVILRGGIVLESVTSWAYFAAHARPRPSRRRRSRGGGQPASHPRNRSTSRVQ